MNDYINITPECKKYNKKPSHFIDNERVIMLSQQLGKPFKVTKGRAGATEIPLELWPEFLLWLSEETRQQVLEGFIK